MAFIVKWATSAQRDFEKLLKHDQSLALAMLADIERLPTLLDTKQVRRLQATVCSYRLKNLGKYQKHRAIFARFDDEEVLYITRVGKREQVYKRLNELREVLPDDEEGEMG